MEVTFRKMEKKDVPLVVELCNEVFKENTSLQYAKSMYKKTKKDKNCTFLKSIKQTTEL